MKVTWETPNEVLRLPKREEKQRDHGADRDAALGVGACSGQKAEEQTGQRSLHDEDGDQIEIAPAFEEQVVGKQDQPGKGNAVIVVLAEEAGENVFPRQHRPEHTETEPLIALRQRAVRREGQEYGLRGQHERRQHQGCGKDRNGIRRACRYEPLPQAWNDRYP